MAPLTLHLRSSYRVPDTACLLEPSVVPKPHQLCLGFLEDQKGLEDENAPGLSHTKVTCRLTVSL